MSSSIFSLYEDEILYSALGRNASIIGITSYRQYITDNFGVSNLIPSFWFPGRLNELVQRLPCDLGISSDYLIYHHTLYPVYAPFLTKDTQEYVIEKMKNSYSKGILNKIGVVAGGVCRKKELYYCPSCATEEFSKFGEAYFHRLHQIEGVLICEYHMRKLIPYRKGVFSSRLEFISLEEKQVIIDIKLDVGFDRKHMNNLIWLNEQFKELLEWKMRLNKDILYDVYKRKLHELGLALPSGSVRQRDLFKSLVDKYQEEFLKLVESNVNSNSEYNWLKTISRNSKNATHPLRHLLLIGLLFDNVNNLISYNENTVYSDRKYPCLNPACFEYLNYVAENIDVHYDYKAKKTIGVFRCFCGFAYSRDFINADEVVIGRIHDFGNVWRQYLKACINKGDTISQISLKLQCDKKTVIRNALLMGLGDKINSKYKTIEEYNEKYGYGKRKIPNRACRIQKKITNKIDSSVRVNWIQRDHDIVFELSTIYPLLKTPDRNKRISKSMLLRTIKKESMVLKNTSKLPETISYLRSNSETIEEYQGFRANKICMSQYKLGKQIRRWEVIRKAGLKEPITKNVEKIIMDWMLLK